VPHTKEGETGRKESTTSDNRSEQQGRPKPGDDSAAYRPNTSLEQISDWLTKILVGVGLVEIKTIQGKMISLAAYIANGLAGVEHAEVLVLTILVYFSVCGFVFGFLWARLYLPRWFREADEVQALGEKVSQLEKRMREDARALALIDGQLNRRPDDPPATEKDVADAIKAASQQVKIQIFNQAEEVSDARNAKDYDIKIPGIISVFKGLIACDTNQQYHRNHSELSYALSREKPPDIDGAEREITKAIEIRDKLRKKGWKYYEFRRARYRIQQDENFKLNTASTSATVTHVLTDLRAARTDTEKWQRWCSEDKTVQQWIELNKIDASNLPAS
jgi:hypothetical protein